MSVQHISVLGELRPVRYNIKAVETIKEVVDICGKDELSYSKALLYGGLVGGAQASLLPFTLSFAEVADWMEAELLTNATGLAGVLGKLNDELTNSTQYKALVPDKPDQEVSGKEITKSRAGKQPVKGRVRAVKAKP